MIPKSTVTTGYSCNIIFLFYKKSKVHHTTEKTILHLILFWELIFTACNSIPSNEYIIIESKAIPNFSDITRLPNGFTLEDYQDYNSIIYLTESTNIPPIEDKDLKLFLTSKELETTLDIFINSTRKVQYYPYE